MGTLGKSSGEVFCGGGGESGPHPMPLSVLILHQNSGCLAGWGHIIEWDQSTEIVSDSVH